LHPHPPERLTFPPVSTHLAPPASLTKVSELSCIHSPDSPREPHLLPRIHSPHRPGRPVNAGVSRSQIGLVFSRVFFSTTSQPLGRALSQPQKTNPSLHAGHSPAHPPARPDDFRQGCRVRPNKVANRALKSQTALTAGCGRSRSTEVANKVVNRSSRARSAEPRLSGPTTRGAHCGEQLLGAAGQDPPETLTIALCAVAALPQEGSPSPWKAISPTPTERLTILMSRRDVDGLPVGHRGLKGVPSLIGRS
jgi:hypothetical protein